MIRTEPNASCHPCKDYYKGHIRLLQEPFFCPDGTNYHLPFFLLRAPAGHKRYHRFRNVPPGPFLPEPLLYDFLSRRDKFWGPVLHPESLSYVFLSRRGKNLRIGPSSRVTLRRIICPVFDLEKTEVRIASNVQGEPALPAGDSVPKSPGLPLTD